MFQELLSKMLAGMVMGDTANDIAQIMVNALRNAPSQDIVRFVETATFTRHSGLAEMVALGLSELSTNAAKDAIGLMLKSQNSSVRWITMHALSHSPDKIWLDELSNMSPTDDAPTRGANILAIGALFEANMLSYAEMRQSAETLAHYLLFDMDEDVRDLADDALSTISATMNSPRKQGGSDAGN